MEGGPITVRSSDGFWCEVWPDENGCRISYQPRIEIVRGERVEIGAFGVRSRSAPTPMVHPPQAEGVHHSADPRWIAATISVAPFPLSTLIVAFESGEALFEGMPYGLHDGDRVVSVLYLHRGPEGWIAELDTAEDMIEVSKILDFLWPLGSPIAFISK